MTWFRIDDLDADRPGRSVYLNLAAIVWITEKPVALDETEIRLEAVNGDVHHYRVKSSNADRLARVLDMATEAP